LTSWSDCTALFGSLKNSRFSRPPFQFEHLSFAHYGGHAALRANRAPGEAERELRCPQTLTGKLFLIDGNFQIGSTTLDM
jgi:hypothetical protein